VIHLKWIQHAVDLTEQVQAAAVTVSIRTDHHRTVFPGNSLRCFGRIQSRLVCLVWI